MFRNSYGLVKITELAYKLEITLGSPRRCEILGIIIQIKLYFDFLLQYQISHGLLTICQLLLACRNMTNCLRIMPKMVAFISSRRFIELKNALKNYIKRKLREMYDFFRGLILNVHQCVDASSRNSTLISQNYKL